MKGMSYSEREPKGFLQTKVGRNFGEGFFSKLAFWASRSCIVKPSEISASTSSLMCLLIPQCHRQQTHALVKIRAPTSSENLSACAVFLLMLGQVPEVNPDKQQQFVQIRGKQTNKQTTMAGEIIKPKPRQQWF